MHSDNRANEFDHSVKDTFRRFRFHSDNCDVFRLPPGAGCIFWPISHPPPPSLSGQLACLFGQFFRFVRHPYPVSAPPIVRIHSGRVIFSVPSFYIRDLFYKSNILKNGYLSHILLKNVNTVFVWMDIVVFNNGNVHHNIVMQYYLQ